MSYFECSECQRVLNVEKPPFVCPQCGLAGVPFEAIDDRRVISHIAEGDEIRPPPLPKTARGTPSGKGVPR